MNNKISPDSSDTVTYAKPNLINLAFFYISNFLIALFVLFALTPLFTTVALAHAEHSEVARTVLVDLEQKDYSVLLSALFGEVKQRVPAEAELYSKTVDEYRFRLAKMSQTNKNLFFALRARFEESGGILDSEKLNELALRIESNHIDVASKVHSDSFLADLIKERYNLVPRSFFTFSSILGKKTKESELSKVKNENAKIRKELEKIYKGIKDLEK